MSKNVWNFQKLVCLIVFLCSITIFGSFKLLSKNLIKSNQRLLLNEIQDGNDTKYDNSCRQPAIDEFPSDFLTSDQRNNGGILIHVLISFYIFGALAIVCDEYFVKSLEIITIKLKLKPDVAGATFMAAGSSAPELFTSLIGVIVAKSDVGLGTIVGSAVFNVLFIIALCALVADRALKLDWYPLTRDCVCYCVAICGLIGVLYDGEIHWYESVILIMLYACYILVMYYNNAIEKSIKIRVNFLKYYQEEETEANITNDIEADATSPLIRPNSITKLDTFENYTNEKKTEQKNDNYDNDDNDDEPINPFKIPDVLLKKIIWLLFLPVSILFYLTIPDCRRKIFSRFPFYFITFLISTCYLAVLSYVLVWMVVIIAFTINIPDTVAGLTLLAAGTSMPEVVTGIIVTRKGKGDMAISNSIGSNIFDILICLGIPWFLNTVIIDTNSIVTIYSGGITYSAVILLSTVVGLIILSFFNKFTLSRKFGLLLFLFWIIVTVITCLFELDYFGNFSIPTCK